MNTKFKLKLKKSIIFSLMLLCTFISISSKYDYDLAICAIFQNEARFMKEWIEFHKLSGIQHFYLYNNFSNDNFKEILDPYMKKGEVELFDCNVKTGATLNAQLWVYNDAIKKLKGTVKWLAFLDLDEFLFPVKKNNLLDFLSDFEKFGGVCANWFMFGTSDIKEIPKNSLSIEYLTKCDPKGKTVVKSIIRPERVEAMYSHNAKYKQGYFQVNPDKIKFNGAFSPYVSYNKIRINHYWTRDIKHFESIKIPRIKSLKENHMTKLGGWYLDYEIASKMKPEEWGYEISKLMNVKNDRLIFKYLNQLKLNMLK